MNLSKNIELRKVKAASSADTSAVQSDAVDMSGFNGVLFFATMGTANAGNFFNAQQDVDAAFGTDPQDIASSKVTPVADGQVAFIDVYRPLDRYVRLEATRGASTAIGDIYAICYEGRVKPTVNEVTDIITGKLLISPDEGTA